MPTMALKKGHSANSSTVSTCTPKKPSSNTSRRSRRSLIPDYSRNGGFCSNRWTVFNVVGLVINLGILGFTLVLYHRIIVATHSKPCLPDDHTLQLPQQVVVQKSAPQEVPVDGLQVSDSSAGGFGAVALPETKQQDNIKQSQAQAQAQQQQSTTTAPPVAVQEQLQRSDVKLKAHVPPIAVDPPIVMELPRRDPDSEFHIIFSTGCSPKQNWQAYVLFHSVMESGQVGHVTRIASGCTAEQTTHIQNIHQTQIEPMGRRSSETSSRFHLHLTPEFGVIYNDGEGRDKVNFHYLNKPYGVAHWMENVLGYSSDNPQVRQHDDTIIMLLDPDMVILRPFVNDFTHNEVWRQRNSYPRVMNIRHGYPMSQEYGYNVWWFRGVKNISSVIPANELPSPAQNMTMEQIRENYTSGPPYLATARDFYKLVSKWRQLAIPVQREFPDTILSEMFAYSWAAAHLNMPHQQAHSFMVSAHFEEGFHLFRRNTNITSNQMCAINNNNDAKGGIPTEWKPHVLHYCQRYALGKYLLGKHRLPKAFVGHSNVTEVCQSPLLVEPPTDLSTQYDYYIDPDTHKRHIYTEPKNGLFSKQEYVDRMAFMLCEFIAALNRAAIYFKQQHCTSGANLKQTLIFYDSLNVTQEEYDNVATN